jgi:hypothetical protein
VTLFPLPDLWGTVGTNVGMEVKASPGWLALDKTGGDGEPSGWQVSLSRTRYATESTIAQKTLVC